MEADGYATRQFSYPSASLGARKRNLKGLRASQFVPLDFARGKTEDSKGLAVAVFSSR